jgi:hypothetical protein
MYDIYEFLTDLDGFWREAAAQLFESHQKLVRCVVPPKQLLETGCSWRWSLHHNGCRGDFYNGHMIGL